MATSHQVSTGKPTGPTTRPWGPPRKLLDAQCLQFERQGFVVIRQLLDANRLAGLKQEAQVTVDAKRLEALQHRVRVLCGPSVAHKQPATIKECQRLLQRADDTVGFLQFFNNWVQQEVVRSLVASEALAGTAAQLLGVPKLRLFQDCIFYKEPGFSETNWHSDLRMAPFDTNHFITAWVPLRPILGEAPPSKQPSIDNNSAAQTARDTTQRSLQRQRKWSKGGRGTRGKQQGPLTPDQLDDSGLLFAAGSHRDFALPFWHDMRGLDLSTRNYKLCSTGAMEVGDVSFHHGWTLHAAGPQHPGTPPRTALAVSYFADGARLLAKSSPSVHKHMIHTEDAESYSGWLKDLKDGQLAVHPKLPLVYPG